MAEAVAQGPMAMEAQEQEAQRPFQLVRYYSVTSLVIILLFALVISVVLSRRAGELVLHKRQQYTLLMAENLNHQVMTRFVIPALEDYGGINVGQPSQFSLLDAVVRNTIHSFQVRQVNILDLEGNIIYSTQPEYIGRSGYDGTYFVAALAGGYASELDPPWEFLEVGGGPARVLKTFIPLRDERRRTAELGPPRAVFEITLDITEDFREVWVNQMIILGTLMAMMLLLFLTLRSIVQRGQRVMARRAEREAQLKEQLNHSERLASLGRMIAGVAHEIRNPLGIVRSTAELLQSQAGETQKELAQVIVDESSRLNRIVTEFLDFARPQAPRLRPTVVEEVLGRNLHVLASEAERAKVRLVQRFAKHPVPILGDPDLLYRAFLNIFGNAVQAMEEGGGGVLTVSTFLEASRGDGPQSPSGDWVVVAVEDTGPGFDLDSRGRLLDPFFTTKEQGTGLGLSIVNNIVTSHGGRLKLTNPPTGGARVEIRLAASSQAY